MARPETLWLSPASLAKVDDDNYRAFIIDKAHLPFPENQSGSKRLIADTMMSVGIEVDPVDITYAPAPGDTRSGYVTIVIIAKITDGAQLNAKKVWTSHPLARSEPVALPDIGVFTINGATHSEMSRAPFGGAGYQIGAYRPVKETLASVKCRLNSLSNYGRKLLFDAKSCLIRVSATACGNSGPSASAA